MSKRGTNKEKKPVFGHKDTCRCTKCRLSNLEIVVNNMMTTVDEILIPHVAQNLKKEGKGLFLRSDGRYVVGTLPAKPKLTKHPDNCPCQICKSIKK